MNCAMFIDCWELGEQDYLDYLDYLHFEEDMATNPYDEKIPTEGEILEMFENLVTNL